MTNSITFAIIPVRDCSNDDLQEFGKLMGCTVIQGEAQKNHDSYIRALFFFGDNTPPRSITRGGAFLKFGNNKAHYFYSVKEAENHLGL